MEKVIRALLATKFQNVDAIMEVINATPNPTVATEVITGIYEEPYWESYLFDLPSNNRWNLTPQSYDKWTNQVTVAFQQKESKMIWLRKGSYLPEYKDLTQKESDHWDYDTAKSKGQIPSDAVRSEWSRETVYGEILPQVHLTYYALDEWNDLVNKNGGSVPNMCA